MKSIKEILMFAKTFFLQQKKKIILLLVIAFSTSILSTIQPNIFGKIIDQAVLGNKQELLVLIITLALVLIITTLLSFVSNKLQLKIGSNIEIELKKNVFNSILHLPVEKFSKLEKGQLMNNISEDINVFSNLFTTRFLIMIDFLSLFIMLFILMNINLFLTLILLINLPVSILLFNYYGKKINQSENQLKCFSDKLSTYIQEVFNGFSIIKTNTSESQFLNVYHKKNQNLYEFGIEKNTYSYLADFFSQQCNNILYIIVIGVGIILIGRGNMTIGELVAFSTYSSRLTVMLLNLTKINTEIEEVIVSVNRIKDIQNTLLTINETSHNKIKLSEKIEEIKLCDFSYKYLDDQYILKNINLNMKKNRIYYLIGKNGSGKSTILNVLSGLYFDYEGKFIINNRFDFNQIDPQFYRVKIGYIPQRTEMFSGTVLENITLYNDIPFEKVIQKCKEAGIHDDIMKLTNGYNTDYGAFGVKFSGGQIQKIGIVRAMLKEADIYVCDEISAFLDKESIQHIEKLLYMLSKKHIVIVIDHNEKDFLNKTFIEYKINNDISLIEYQGE